MVGACLRRALDNVYQGDGRPGYVDRAIGALPYCRDEVIHDLARTDTCQEPFVSSFSEPLLAGIEAEEHQVQPRSDCGASLSSGFQSALATQIRGVCTLRGASDSFAQAAAYRPGPTGLNVEVSNGCLSSLGR